MTKIKVALLYGGRSGEHEVSLMSALSVFNALNRENYEVFPIGLTKEGGYYLNKDNTDLISVDNSLLVQGNNAIAIDSLIKNDTFALAVDVVLPIVHGPLYEDGALQGLLELANCAYIGCDVLASAIAMDKEMAKRIVNQLGIRTADYHLMTSQMSKTIRSKRCHQIANHVQWPVFVKPNALGSSVGTFKVNSLEELHSAVEEALHYDTQVLIEEYIDGQEIEFAVLENIDDYSAPFISDAGEIIANHPDGFYSYNAKYFETGTTELSIPARINQSVNQQAKQIAAKIFNTFKCSAMARIDMFVTKDNQIVFNEINTIPGFTQYSMYPKLIETLGLSYADLLDKLIELALKKQQMKRKLITNYQ